MNSNAPDALLFITPGCPHCPVVLQGLSELVKEGAIGALEVVNVAQHPERAAELGVRSAPWTRIGSYILQGAQSPAELKRWVERAASGNADAEYLRELLGSGGLADAQKYVEEDPQRLKAIIPLLEDTEAPMQVRLGAGALLEGQAGREGLKALIPELGRLSRHEDHRVRGDACHYLGLTGSEEAVALLEQREQDPSEEVREIAAESLETLRGAS
jgi:hypothetical protein